MSKIWMCINKNKFFKVHCQYFNIKEVQTYRKGMTRFLSPIRGLSGSAKRQTTTWPFRTVIAA